MSNKGNGGVSTSALELAYNSEHMNTNVSHIRDRSSKTTDLYHSIILILTRFPVSVFLPKEPQYFILLYFCLCYFLFFLKCCSCPSSLVNCYLSLKIQLKCHFSMKFIFLLYHTTFCTDSIIYEQLPENHLCICLHVLLFIEGRENKV